MQNRQVWFWKHLKLGSPPSTFISRIPIVQRTALIDKAGKYIDFSGNEVSFRHSASIPQFLNERRVYNRNLFELNTDDRILYKYNGSDPVDIGGIILGRYNLIKCTIAEFNEVIDSKLSVAAPTSQATELDDNSCQLF